MRTKTDIYVNLFGCCVMMFLMYYFIYAERQEMFQAVKSILPLMCFLMGWIFHKTLNELNLNFNEEHK